MLLPITQTIWCNEANGLSITNLSGFTVWNAYDNACSATGLSQLNSTKSCSIKYSTLLDRTAGCELENQSKSLYLYNRYPEKISEKNNLFSDDRINSVSLYVSDDKVWNYTRMKRFHTAVTFYLNKQQGVFLCVHLSAHLYHNCLYDM